MKKKILLNLTVIMSMFVCISNVKANDACYVCQSTGEYVWGDTSKSTCQNNDWKLMSDITKKKNCEYNCSDKSSCDKGVWLAKCEYVQLGGDERIYLYYNSYLKKVVVGNETIEGLQKNWGLGGACKYGDGIDLKDLINQYNTGSSNNKGCPGAIYYKKEAVSGGHGTGTCYEFSLSSKGADFNSSNTNDKYYSLVTDGKIVEDDKKNNDPTSCGDLLGEEVVDLINEIMKWVRIAVPLLLIGFGIMDFSKAVFGSKEDDMKKSRETFIKRIVAAVLVFLSPMFINLILDLANSVWGWISPDTCIR